MSKNTGTSELINYFDLGVNGDVGISGSLTLDTGSLNGTSAVFSSAVTASSFIYSGGTLSQFLKADGSLDSNVYALNSALGSYQLTADKSQPNGYASLDGNGKVPLTQINDALIGNVIFQGLWNASTNTPTLVDPPSSGTKGYYYIVSVAGTFAGITFEVGDWIISDGTAWGKVDNTDAVSSVFGRTGNVVASNGDYNTSQVTESGNLYYTEARVSANTDVAANTAARHNAVTLGTANGLSLSTQQLSLGLASAGVTGALSGTDWNTFNNKQNALTNPVTGTGTAGQVSFWNGTNTQTGDNGLFWDNTNKLLGVGTAIPAFTLDVRKDLGTGTQSVLQITNSNETYAAGLGSGLIFAAGTGTTVGTITAAMAGGSFSNGSIINLTTRAGSLSSINFNVNSAERWRITSTGILQSNGAQTIQTSSGVLTLQPTGGVNLATSSGNVGIGTATPVGKLNINTGTTGIDINVVNQANGTISFGNGSGGSAVPNIIGKSINNVGLIINSAVPNVPASGYDMGFNVVETDNTDFDTLTSSAYRFFRAGNPLMTIQRNGSVGIGTTVPSTKFHVLSGTSNTSVATFSGSNLNRGLKISTFNSGNNDGGVILDAQVVTGILTFATEGNERMRITSGGNIGIGTSSPSTRLDIANGTLTLPTLRGRTYQLSNVSSANPNFVNGTGFNSIPVRVGDIIDLPFGQTRTVVAVTDSVLTVNSAWTVSFGGSNVEGRGGIVFETNNAERMRLTSGGNVGIGTALPGSQVAIEKSSNSGSGSAFPRLAIKNTLATQGDGSSTFNFADILISSGNESVNMFLGTTYAAGTWAPAGIINVATNHDLQIKTNNTERMRITSVGNVGIGTDSPTLIGAYRSLTLNGTDGSIIDLRFNTNGNGRIYSSSDAAVGIESLSTTLPLVFKTQNGSGSTERMRITSGGFLKASNTGTYASSTGQYHELISNIGGTQIANFFNTSANPYGPYIRFSGAAPNNGTNYFMYFDDNAVSPRFVVYSNGGIANYQANDTNLSDERVKKDIEPLESYWDKFKEIEIVKFKYKDQTHDDFNIGVIAQQVEAVAPEFVDVDGWNKKPELDEEGNEIVIEEEPLKSIYTADLHHATIKVLQEAMAKIEELQIQIDSLKNQMQ